MSDMQAWNHQGELEQQYTEQNIADSFNTWLYKNYYICNGNHLVSLMENHRVVAEFLKDMGLPLDIEF